MSSDITVQARALSKAYPVFRSRQARFKQLLFPRGKYYDDFWALDDVSFELRRGETLGVIGRNGSGKSTLLQLMCGTLKPTRGTVEVRGRFAAILELGAGFNPEFTGRENVYLNAAIHGLSRGEADARMDAILAFADIGDFIDQPVKTFSSGMYVRLAFSIIANLDADVLVIDEALAVGDAYFTQKCMRFLRQFQQERTLVFVSHDVGAVQSLCDRAIWLDRGKVKESGLTKVVCERYLGAIYASAQPTAQLAPVPSQPSLPAGGEPFGTGECRIVSVELLDEHGGTLRAATRPMAVTLLVTAEAIVNLHRPVVGFFVKDRLGQSLFGENTLEATRLSPVEVAAGQRLQARFRFSLPRLGVGMYSVCVAVGEGSETSLVIHHWIHDVLVFEVPESSIRVGVVELPMDEVTLARLDTPEPGGTAA